jgi:hypothetical protein
MVEQFFLEILKNVQLMSTGTVSVHEDTGGPMRAKQCKPWGDAAWCPFYRNLVLRETIEVFTI